jgi:FMN reductase
MSLRFHWFLPTNGDGRDIVGGGHGVATGTAGVIRPATLAYLLKAFLDRYGSNGLAGTVAVPVMTGGWPGHLLAVEVHLRPVLVELGATVPARGLYVTEPDISTPDAAIAKWAEAAVPLIRLALAPAPRP